MKDDVRLANERSGMKYLIIPYIIVLSFMMGIIVSCGLLSHFGKPTDDMTNLMLFSFIPFLGFTVLVIIVSNKRDKILKSIRGESN